jgi:hypothetical protein
MAKTTLSAPRSGPRRVRRFLGASLLLALGLSLPGCQVWNGWLKMLMVNPDNSTRTAKGKPTKGEQLAQPNGPAAANLPRIVVYKISVPVGTFSANEKVWAELNEDALDSKTSVLMAQNGLRAGTGPLARWPAINRLVDVPGATTDKFVCQTDGRSSLNVVTRSGVADQIVVSINRDLEQRGQAFERCDNGFRLSMRGVRNKPELVVQLEPVVTLGTVNITRPQGAVGVVSQQEAAEEGFPDLRMAATLEPDQFLVLAPVSPKDNTFSVGSLWLSDPDKVPALETVLVFVPAVVGSSEETGTKAK